MIFYFKIIQRNKSLSSLQNAWNVYGAFIQFSLRILFQNVYDVISFLDSFGFWTVSDREREGGVKNRENLGRLK